MVREVHKGDAFALADSEDDDCIITIVVLGTE